MSRDTCMVIVDRALADLAGFEMCHRRSPIPCQSTPWCWKKRRPSVPGRLIRLGELVNAPGCGVGRQLRKSGGLSRS